MPFNRAASYRPHPAAALVFAAWSAACGRPGDAPVARTDSSGVEIVALTSGLEALAWRADTVRLLGGRDDGPAGFYQVRASLIDTDAQGRIVVLDPSRHRVVVFDSAGTFLREMGREGDGPGELRAPLGVSVSDSDEIAVHDASRVGLVRFRLDGTVLPLQAYPFSTINTRFRHVDLVPRGIVIWARDRAGADDRLDRLLLIALDDTTELVAGRSSYRSTAIHPACGMAFTIRLPLSPAIYWSQWGNRIAVAAWDEDRVDLFDGERLIRSIRLAPRSAEIDEEEAVRLVEASGRRGPCNSTARELVRRHGFHSRVQMIRGVAVAPDGAVWIGRQDSDGETRISVWNPNGVPIGSLPARFPMPLNFLPDGRALVAVRDSLDVERIGILRVHRG